jgi:cytochrome c oxidase subunit 2
MKILRPASLLALLALALCSFGLAQNPPREIAITAKRFEFSPKELRLKKGEPVTLVLTSQDVTHGFMSKPLGIKATIPPGQETRVTLTPAETGTFPTICSHFCGSGHAGMKMTIIVE